MCPLGETEKEKEVGGVVFPGDFNYISFAFAVLSEIQVF